MSERNDLEEKLQSFWEPHAKERTPIEAAASAVALKRLLKAENPSTLGELKEKAVYHLDTVVSLLYKMSTLHKGGDHRQRKKERDYLKKNNIQMTPDGVGSSTFQIPKEYRQAFNQLASSEKTKFLKEAGTLSRKMRGSFADFEQNIHGVFANEGFPLFVPIVMQYYAVLEDHKESLFFCLSEVKHPLIQHEGETVRLDDGPKNSVEMALCTMMFLEATQNLMSVFQETGVKPFEYNHTRKAAKNFLHVIDGEIQSDLPEAKQGFYKTEYRDIAHRAIAGRNPTSSRLVDLMHYYLEHSRERMGLSAYAHLRVAREQFREGVHLDTFLGRGVELNEGIIEAVAYGVQSEYDTMFQEYDRPSADEVFDNTMDAIEAYYDEVGRPDLTQEKQARFEEMLSETPEGLEDVVLLHYQENEEIRKIRKGVFRSQKEKFLKDLAVQYTDDLLDAGFSDDDIARMREKGKLPSGSDWTVEHIVDRDHGGTNHWHNFVLMSDEINTLKDTLKKIQTYVQPDADQGCWIRSWVPKKLLDGTYPKIVTSHDTHAEELEIELSPA